MFLKFGIKEFYHNIAIRKIFWLKLNYEYFNGNITQTLTRASESVSRLFL
jgi:hypothetical protein